VTAINPPWLPNELERLGAARCSECLRRNRKHWPWCSSAPLAERRLWADRERIRALRTAVRMSEGEYR
jgi:hypothetical protein